MHSRNMHHKLKHLEGVLLSIVLCETGTVRTLDSCRCPRGRGYHLWHERWSGAWWRQSARLQPKVPAIKAVIGIRTIV